MSQVLASLAAGNEVQIEAVLEGLQHLKVNQYVTVASFTLLVFDIFLTLSDEIALVWPSKWRLPKILYFWNRYIAVGDSFMLLYVALVGGSQGFCTTAFRTLGWFMSSGFICAQVILMMRTWAIWEQSKWVSGLLLAELLIGLGIDIYVVHKYLFGVTTSPPVSPAIKGCLLQFDNRIVFVDFLIVIFVETTLLALLIVKAASHFKHARSALMVRMYNDGIFYYTFILMSSVANLATIFASPMELHNMLIITQRVLHSIFCSRVLLHIRGAFSQPYQRAHYTDEDGRVDASRAYRRAIRPPFGQRNQPEPDHHGISGVSGIFTEDLHLDTVKSDHDGDDTIANQDDHAFHTKTSGDMYGIQPSTASSASSDQGTRRPVVRQTRFGAGTTGGDIEMAALSYLRRS